VRSGSLSVSRTAGWAASLPVSCLRKRSLFGESGRVTSAGAADGPIDYAQLCFERLRCRIENRI